MQRLRCRRRATWTFLRATRLVSLLVMSTQMTPTGMSMPLTEVATVWVDDPHPIFRRGLTACLKAAGFALAGESADFTPAPDVSAIDLLLFDLDGDGLRSAMRLCPDSRVKLVAVTSLGAEHAIYEAVEAGLTGVLIRSEMDPRTLVESLRAVLRGSVALPSELMPRLLHRAAHGGTSGIRGLVEREHTVLRMLSEGQDTRQIADRLGYSERTVKNVVHDLLVKMNCKNRAHAVGQATRMGLI